MSYIYSLADTWNAGGTTFTGIGLNVTDTASAAGSALIDLQVGGASQFKVTKAGAVTAVGVAIPTISSTDTLSNKTLSSPTLSGTVAGSPVYSGLQSIANATGANQGQKITPNGWASFRTGAINTSGDDFYLAYNWRPSTADRDDNSIVSNAIHFSSLGIDFYASGAASGSPTSRMRVSNSGTVTIGGVAVPTISSTDTLSNKTLSSPTLSGTVAGSPTFSGQLTLTSASEPLIINRTAAAQYSVILKDNGTTRGYLGVSSGYPFIVQNESASTALYVTSAGVVNANTSFTAAGVAVPTISSTDTLSNKTVRTVASTTGGAGLRIPSGVAPTTPVSGDIWYDGTNLKFQDGATTRTLTWT